MPLLEDTHIEYVEYIEAQRAFLSTLIYSEASTMNKSAVIDIVNSMTDDMFYDEDCKKVFQIYKNIFEKDFEIIGSIQFARKIKMIASLEAIGLDIFIDELQGSWNSFVTINYQVRIIHKFFFKQLFKQAETEEQFNEIILLKRKLSRDMMLSDISDDASEILERYEEAAKKHG